VKLGPSLLITIGVAVAYAFIHDTVRLLDLAILMALWLLIGIPIGMAILHRVHNATKRHPPKPLTELEQLWQEIGPPDTPMTPSFRPPEHKPAIEASQANVQRSKAAARTRQAQARMTKPVCTHPWRAGTCRNCPLR
jgi:hypothetical protein